MAHVLEGIRILDFTGGVAGPIGVLQLAEHGADVIKVEPPGGSDQRRSPGSVAVNRSRRSLTVDLTDPEGLEVVRDLVATADVVVEAFADGTMDRLGLGHQELCAANPRLVYCSIPAWPSGTRFAGDAGYEALVHARTGQQWENTSFRDGPVFLHSPVASMGAMLLLPVGVMAALVARDRTGRGQHVEISLLQGVLSLTTQIWNWTDKGQFMLERTHPPGVHQASIFECADGKWIHAATMAGVPQTRTEADVLGIRDIDMATRMSMSADELATWEDERRAAYRGRDRDELVEEFHAAGLGAEAIIAPHERFDHPQLQAAGSVVQVDDPDVGPTTQFAHPIFLERTPSEVRGPQPRPGAHTDEILGELGRDQEAIAALRTRGVI